MTRKSVVECDWYDCKESAPAFEQDNETDLPVDWSVVIDGDKILHLCPKDSFKLLRWVGAGISEGEQLEVKHHCPDDYQLETAHVHAGTHGMHIAPYLDEPPTRFEEYDPPLGTKDQEEEAWGFHVFDHLHVLIIGSHKSDPRVIVESDEFPTVLEIDDRENSFEFPLLDEAMDEVRQRWSYGEDMDVAAYNGARTMFKVMTGISD